MIAAMIHHAAARITGFARGHRRGKRVSDTHVKCPRCKSEWKRDKKVKA